MAHPCEETHPNARPPTHSATMISVGAVSTALLASVCCIGPVVFAALGVGVGATSALASTAWILKGLLPYRPLFIGLTLLLLGMTFYMAYRKPSLSCGSAEGCAPRSVNGPNHSLVWLLAAMALILVLAPYWLVL
ncbi:MAG TPA: mercuric transporter MerT family protein [Nitrospira sp.]|nr:mercuric transporter MerT family protein [Nitrospira sp.]